MNFIGEGVQPAEQFLHEIRRVNGQKDFFRICETYLDHDRHLTLEPEANIPATELATECQG
jgi:hypothetical protein